MSDHREPQAGGEFAQALVLKKFEALETAITNLVDVTNENRLKNAQELAEVKEELAARIADVKIHVARLETQAEERGRRAGSVYGAVTSIIVSVFVLFVKEILGK